MLSRTLSRVYYDIPTARVSILFCSFVRVSLGPKEADRQKPETPLPFCSPQKIFLISPILGVWRTFRTAGNGEERFSL